MNLATVSRMFYHRLAIPKRTWTKFPQGIALRLWRVCSSDEKFDIGSSEYQNYLIARYYNPTLVKKMVSLYYKYEQKWC